MQYDSKGILGYPFIYNPISLNGTRGITIYTRVYRNRERYSVLITLIYFLPSPLSTIPNCVLNSLVSNATPRIKRFENFSQSLWMLLLPSQPSLCTFAHILNLILQFPSFNFVISQDLPSLVLFHSPPIPPSSLSSSIESS